MRGHSLLQITLRKLPTDAGFAKEHNNARARAHVEGVWRLRAGVGRSADGGTARGLERRGTEGAEQDKVGFGTADWPATFPRLEQRKGVHSPRRAAAGPTGAGGFWPQSYRAT